MVAQSSTLERDVPVDRTGKALSEQVDVSARKNVALIFETRPKARGHAPVFARVDVYNAAEPVVLEAWADLEALAPCSIYQSRAWLLPWIETLGAKAGIEAAFVVARDQQGAAIALLAIGLSRQGWVRIAHFLGGKDSNFNMALLRPGHVWSKTDWRRFLADAAKGLGSKAPDAFLLVNQPHDWAGIANTLAALPFQPSPSAAYGTTLMASPEDMFAKKLSKDARKKLRKKLARLADIGPVTALQARTAEDRAALLDCFFAQKVERFRAQGIVSRLDDPAMRLFLEKASSPGPHGTGIELHGLDVDGRIVAVYGGAAQGESWSGMFNSFDGDPEIAKSSPGDLLLMKVIETQCLAGRTRFDLGIGEARYKATFCEDVIPLFDTFVPTTAKGWLYIKVHALALRIKRAVKQRPRLFALAKRMRTLLRGSPAGV